MNKILDSVKGSVDYLSGYGASEQAVNECMVSLLDTIIEDMKEEHKILDGKYNPDADHSWRAEWRGETNTLSKQIEKLKQAREDITSLQ